MNDFDVGYCEFSRQLQGRGLRAKNLSTPAYATFPNLGGLGRMDFQAHLRSADSGANGNPVECLVVGMYYLFGYYPDRMERSGENALKYFSRAVDGAASGAEAALSMAENVLAARKAAAEGRWSDAFDLFLNASGLEIQADVILEEREKYRIEAGRASIFAVLRQEIDLVETPREKRILQMWFPRAQKLGVDTAELERALEAKKVLQ